MKNILDFLARIFISLVFLISAFRKITNYEGTVDWMEGFGVPGFLLTPVIILEIIAPLMIIVGYKVKIFSSLLSIFCITTAFIFLNDFPNQIVAFSKLNDKNNKEDYDYYQSINFVAFIHTRMRALKPSKKLNIELIADE